MQIFSLLTFTMQLQNPFAVKSIEYLVQRIQLDVFYQVDQQLIHLVDGNSGFSRLSETQIHKSGLLRVIQYLAILELRTLDADPLS